MQVDNVTKSEMEMNLANPTENIVCAIDIGTSKIAALVGRKNQFGKIEILKFPRVITTARQVRQAQKEGKLTIRK